MSSFCVFFCICTCLLKIKCGATEATYLGCFLLFSNFVFFFVCFIISPFLPVNPCVLLANRVDLGFLFHYSPSPLTRQPASRSTRFSPSTWWRWRPLSPTRVSTTLCLSSGSSLRCLSSPWVSWWGWGDWCSWVLNLLILLLGLMWIHSWLNQGFLKLSVDRSFISFILNAVVCTPTVCNYYFAISWIVYYGLSTPIVISQSHGDGSSSAQTPRKVGSICCWELLLLPKYLVWYA